MAVVKGLTVGPIEMMVLAAGMQLSRLSSPNGQGVAVVKKLAVGPIETMVLVAGVQLSRPGGQGVNCS